MNSFLFKIIACGIFCLLLSQTVSAQARYRNNFRTGVGFAYIVEGDNSGAIFTQQYTRELTDRLNFSLSGEYLSSSRYDQGKEIFTSRKAFVMFDASLYFDLLENDKFTIKIGAGPAVRRRSEVDLVQGAINNNSGTPGTTADEHFIHNRERDFGGKIVLENDFHNDNRLFFGWRASGYFYNAGSSIFSAGLTMGYSF
ncbi:hypothetical protein [Rufibacter roseus]|uniref:Outer membrane protein beta-barrel domain-containing protein n=1 Tax=Rufibacter roseus TaxID=1567108 RepID=A0ABW2DJN4_9BACT|nr:hypothetical protein [Rufibacter roseus]